MKTLSVLLLFALSGSVVPAVSSPRAGAAPQTQEAPAARPSERASELLRELAGEFRAMKSYTVAFTIAAGESDVAGSYTVQSGGYTLTIGDAEVFFDGKVRYEVDHARREVTINAVDTTSRNILDNPIGAFDFLDGAYRPTLLSDDGSEALVRLTPTDGESATGVVTVRLELHPVRPQSLAYDYDGEQVTVSVRSIEPFAGKLRRFDPKSCAGYEMIDFR